MTNREALMEKMNRMTDEVLAQYLSESIGDEIALAICEQCQNEHGGDCIKETQHLDRCPKTITEWLKEDMKEKES